MVGRQEKLEGFCQTNLNQSQLGSGPISADVRHVQADNRQTIPGCGTPSTELPMSCVDGPCIARLF